jgi:integrase
MGAIYRPKFCDRHGVIKESAVWWVRFRQYGKTVRQSTETTSDRKARAFLREREGKVALKIPVIPKADKLTLSEGANLIRQDYRANERKSLNSLEPRLTHLLTQLGPGTRLARLTTGAVESYKTARLTAKAAPATINRELAALQRIAALARHQYGLVPPFAVERLEERNARVGFFDGDAFTAVCRQLRSELAALATVARITGWRKGELRSRQWRHVDFEHGWLRLEPEETKNRDGRMFPLVPELRTTLEAQRARVETIQRRTKQMIPWVFCRDDGAPVGDFKKAWTTACIRAGFYRDVVVLDGDGKPRAAKDGTPLVVKKPTKLVHDFRRTSVRNLIRAGIPETVAMKLTGHRTRSVFQRYAIVEEGMLKEAGDRLAAGVAGEGGKVRAESGKVVELKP